MAHPSNSALLLSGSAAPSPRRGLSIQWHLALFGLAIVIPILVVAVLVAVHAASVERARSQDEALQVARNIADDIDRELDSAVAVLQALAFAPILLRGDFVSFDGLARAIAKLRGTDLALRDLSGRQLINTRVPYGTALPFNSDPELRRADVLATHTRKPVVSNLVVGSAGPVLVVDVPVMRDGEPIYIVNMRFDPERIRKILTARDLPPAVVAAVVDGNYLLIARSFDSSKYLGTESTAAFRKGATTTEGKWEGTDRTGVDISGAYASTKLANWRVGVTVPTEVLEAPLRQSLLFIAALGASALGLSFLVAVLLSRQMTRPMQAMVTDAAGLSRGKAFAAVGSSVREIAQIGDMLSLASIELRRQTTERDRAETLLRQSEERVRCMTEAALQSSQERFRLLVDSIKDYAIIMLDPQGVITTWNKGAERIMGYGANEIIGHSFSLFYSPEDIALEKPLRGLGTAAAEGRWADTGWRFRRDGTTFWAEVIITPIYTGNGILTGFSKVIRDLSASQYAERKFEALLEAAPDAIVIVDSGGDIVIINSQAETLFGYLRKEMIGKKIEFLLPKRFHAVHPSRRDDFFATPKARPMGAGLELFGQRKDGTEFPLEISLSPIETAEGTLVSSSVRDITGRREQEKALRDKNVALELAVNDLDAFSYSVSHDLRAPVRAVGGFSRILLKEYGDTLTGEAHDYLERVHDNAMRMGEMVDDLLTFSRLGRQQLNKKQVKTGAIVAQILADEQALAGERGVKVSVGDLPNILGDATLLKQVFVNLIGNAFKYTQHRKDAIIEIDSHETAGETVFVIRDNGAGFDMQYAGKLFDVFSRLHRAEDFDGTGVGLAIVKRIIDRHGGRIWADATVDKGATFSFTTEGVKT